MAGNGHTIEDIDQLVAFAQTFKDILVQRRQQKKSRSVRPSRSANPQDALASILADGTQGEAYAIGAHVDPSTPTGPVTLVVASNYEIADSTEDYLRNIWVRLRSMGKVHHRNRRGNNSHPQPRFSREYRSLIRKIYSHCFARFKKRVLQGYGSMMELAESEEFKIFLRENTTQGDRDDIYLLLDLVEEMGMKLEEFTVSEFLEDEELLMERMENFYQAIRKQRETLTGLDKLCYKLKCPPIQKYMDKVAALHGSIKVLGWYSKLSFIRRRLVVKRLTSESVTVQPPTLETCRKFIRRIFGIVNCYHSNSDRRTVVDYIVRTAEERHRADKGNRSVHPECKVLEYFLTRPFSTPPLRYIGASRAPCVACMALFRARNTISPYKTYKCRGSQGKLRSWGFPRGLRAVRRRGKPKGPIHAIYKRMVAHISMYLGTIIKCPICHIRRAAQLL